MVVMALLYQCCVQLPTWILLYQSRCWCMLLFRSLLAINASTSSFKNCHPSFVLLYLSFQSTSYTSNIICSSHYLGWPLLYRLPRFSKEEDCIAYIRLGHVYSFFRQISPPTPHFAPHTIVHLLWPISGPEAIITFCSNDICFESRSFIVRCMSTFAQATNV